MPNYWITLSPSYGSGGQRVGLPYELGGAGLEELLGKVLVDGQSLGIDSLTSQTVWVLVPFMD